MHKATYCLKTVKGIYIDADVHSYSEPYLECRLQVDKIQITLMNYKKIVEHCDHQQLFTLNISTKRTKKVLSMILFCYMFLFRLNK